MDRDDRAGYSIFIAHAPADTGVAEELTPLLAETGATVLYGADTSPTPEAQDELEQAALAADAYVALLSPASIASPRMRALTRKYHDVRQADPRRILLPVSIAPLTPGQLWPFLLDYTRIEALPRTINEVGERMAIAPEILALGVMQGLYLPIPARLRRVMGTPVEQSERLRRPSRPISAPLTGSLVPQLHPPARRPWRPSRTLTLGAVAAALVVALVATLAYFGGATPFPLDGSAPPRPTATIRTLILTTSTPDASTLIAPTATGAATGTAAPQPTATPAPSSTATTSPPPPLTLSALHLSQDHANQCAGSQTISNSGGQQMTWQWDSIQPSAHPSFLYGVNTTAQFGGFPADLFPGVAAGGTDRLNVQMKCTGQTYTVTLRDGLSRTQQFTMVSD
jgi:TIR domain